MPVDRTPVRAAVVGAGGIVSGSRLQALRAHSGRVRLVGAADVDDGRLAAFLELAGDGVNGCPDADVPGSYVARLGGFPDALEKGERPPGSGADARRALEFLAALYKSAFTAAPVHKGEITPQDPVCLAMHGDHPDRAPKEHR